jgi:hypothetical protein
MKILTFINRITMNYLHEILEFLSWPVFIILSYQLVKLAVNRFEKKSLSDENKE